MPAADAGRTPKTFIVDCPYCKAKVAAEESGMAESVYFDDEAGEPIGRRIRKAGAKYGLWISAERDFAIRLIFCPSCRAPREQRFTPKPV